MKAYAAKMYTLLRKQGYACPIAKDYGTFAKPTALHHLCHNTKPNRKKYPLLIDSLWNLMAVNHDWHMMHPSFGKIRDLEAASRERFLERHPLIAKAINMEESNVLEQSFTGTLPFGEPCYPSTDGRRDYPMYLLGGSVSRQSKMARKLKASSARSNGRRAKRKGPSHNTT